MGEPGGNTVLPRRSFERWVEERRGYSEPWPSWQVRIAGSLATALDGVVLRQSRKVEELIGLLRDKERLLAQKEVLTREIDHRVKNSLQTVSSFLQMQARTVSDHIQCAIAAGLGRTGRNPSRFPRPGRIQARRGLP